MARSTSLPPFQNFHAGSSKRTSEILAQAIRRELHSNPERLFMLNSCIPFDVVPHDENLTRGGGLIVIARIDIVSSCS